MREKEYFEKLSKKIKDNCTKCNGAGWLWISGLQQACDCMEELLAIASVARGNFPKEYWEYTLQQYSGDQKSYRKVVSIINDWANTKNESLFFFVLSGTSRIGKTTLSCCLAKFYYQYNQELNILYTTARELERALFDQADDLIQEAEKCDFLIIDDVGKENTFTSESSHKRMLRGILDQIVRTRRRFHPTILTTNLTLEQIRTFYGKNIGLILENDFNFIEFPPNAKVIGIT